MGCASSSLEEPASDKSVGPRGEPQPCKFADTYKIGAKLGSGGFAVVKLATHVGSRYEYAVKLMTVPAEGAPTPESGATRKEILNEIKILATIEHATCLHMKEWFLESSKALIVMEYVRGGELLEALSSRGTYSESDARAVFRQLLDGLVYLHSKDIVHRDLKLENLMLSKAGNITEGLKIVDFGLARFGGPFDEDDMCGTPLYVAPEVVGAPGPGGVKGAKGVTMAVDMWAAGIILYMLLSGSAPFMHADDMQLFSLIRRGHLSFKDPCWTPVSAAGKELIKSLVVVKAGERLRASDARKHAWFGADVPTAPLEAAQSGLRKIAMRRKFKGAVKGVVAARRMATIMNSIRAAADEEEKAPEKA